MKRSPLRRLLYWFLLVPGLSLAAWAQDGSDQSSWQPVSEHWYVLEINGAAAGWTHEKVDRDDERYRSSSQMHLRIDRGGTAVAISSRAGFIETLDGAPLKIRQIENMSSMVRETEWIFDEAGIRSVVQEGNRTSERRLDAPEGRWLTPQAVHRYWLEQLGDGAERISYRMLDMDDGLAPITVSSELKNRTTIEREGREVAVGIWHTTTSNLPGITSVETIDSEGLLLREEVQLPFGTMVTRLADKAEALAAEAGPAPELVVESFVRLNKPVANVLNMEKAAWRLRVRDGTMPELPSAGAQRFALGDDDRTALLVVDMTDPLPASGAELDDAAYRQSSALVDSDDPLVRRRAERALRGIDGGAAAQAEALRQFVFRFLTEKDLGTAFASASETIRTRQGDCSEHAVLLCALLRASDIPARVAGGLVYVDQFLGERSVFGWHMWTQALIDDKWIDLDATLPVSYHAGHVLTNTTSLADGRGDGDLSSMLRLLGNLEIEMVDTDE